jgi:uncharacterized protein (DUF697 family)
MTRKPLPKVIRRPSESLRVVAADVVTDEEAPAPIALPRGTAAPPHAAPPAAGVQLPAVSPRTAAWAAKRRALARKIVERHKTYAAVGGLFPVPIVNIAGVSAIIMRMVKQLSDLYQVPFERDRTRSIIIGLMGGAVPTGLGAATTSTLAFVVPGSALMGLAVSAISAGALTRGVGLVFIESFESGAMPLGVTDPQFA